MRILLLKDQSKLKNGPEEKSMVEVCIQRLQAKVDNDHDKTFIRTQSGVAYDLGIE
ncbi:MAG: hypothetical protein ACKO8Z_03725 [Prosthecobacter sp.]